MLHCSYVGPKPDHPKEQSKSETAAVLLTGIAESSTASRARMRLQQEVRWEQNGHRGSRFTTRPKHKGKENPKRKTVRVLAGACSARKAWQACPRRSGDLVVLRP